MEVAGAEVTLDFPSVGATQNLLLQPHSPTG